MRVLTDMNKRAVIAVLVTLFGLTTIVIGQERTQPSVRILFSEPSVSYCDGGDHLVFASVQVNVSFENRSHKNVILSRELGRIDRIRLKDRSGAVVFSPDAAYYGTPHPPLLDSPDDKRFAIIKPGSSANREVLISIPLSLDPAHRHGSPLPGQYRISAKAGTWPYFADPEAAARTRALWSRYGALLIAPVYIKDVFVQLSPPSTAPACSN